MTSPYSHTHTPNSARGRLRRVTAWTECILRSEVDLAADSGGDGAPTPDASGGEGDGGTERAQVRGPTGRCARGAGMAGRRTNKQGEKVERVRETGAEMVRRERRKTEMGKELKKKLRERLAHRREFEHAAKNSPCTFSKLRADRHLQVGRWILASV